MRSVRGLLRSWAAVTVLAAPLAACDDIFPRRAELPPPPGTISDARQGTLQAGPDRRLVPLTNPYEGDSRAINEGHRLFLWFNCAGCHGGYGGGGIGPPLVNGERNPASDFDYIYSGRGGGMPAYGGRVPDDQIWMLVAYISALQREEIAVPEVPTGPAPDAGSHVARGAP